MIKVGLTGGIGSGKTYVSTVFASLGIPVFHADDLAKEAYYQHDIKEQVISLLGKNSYTNQELNRSFIAQKIFKNKDLLDRLNNIIHPWVGRKFTLWTDNMAEYPYVLKEAAILFESGSNKNLDQVICVHAPDKTRITRVVKRDRCDSQDVINRMKHQWSQSKIMEISDYIINNDGTNLVIPQVLKIHQSIIQ